MANIIAKRAEKTLYYLNATTASLQDVKDVIADVGTLMAPNGILLYLDEIQYFNKKQQQSLLEFLENGKITLSRPPRRIRISISTTHSCLAAPCFEFKPLSVEDTVPCRGTGPAYRAGEKRSCRFRGRRTPKTVAAGCGGDVRKAINAVELLYRSAKPKDGGLYVTRDDAFTAKSAQRYAL